MNTKIAIKEGLTIREYYVLQTLAQDGKKIISSLNCGLMTNAALTAIVDKLCYKHLIGRERCKEDRRKIYVSLTEKGQSYFANKIVD